MRKKQVLSVHRKTEQQTNKINKNSELTIYRVMTIAFIYPLQLFETFNFVKQMFGIVFWKNILGKWDYICM